MSCYDVDDLLDHVDEWKFKLHEELKNLTAAERAEYWKKAREEARVLGFTVAEPEPAAKRPVKRSSRARYEVDDLLDEVDQWKFKLHEKLKKMTAKQQAEFWKQSRQRARALGLNVIEPEAPTKRAVKRSRRTG